MPKNNIIKTFGMVLLGGLCLSFFAITKQDTSYDDLLLQNVEALTQSEDVDHYWCCGNTGVCGRGPNLIIKGTLSAEPCKE